MTNERGASGLLSKLINTSKGERRFHHSQFPLAVASMLARLAAAVGEIALVETLARCLVPASMPKPDCGRGGRAEALASRLSFCNVEDLNMEAKLGAERDGCESSLVEGPVLEDP